MKYLESNLPKGLYIKVVHLHQGNTTRSQLKKIGKTNTRYVTIAKLFDDNHPFSVAQGMAVCGHNDSPSRQLGRSIAVGRALREYQA